MRIVEIIEKKKRSEALSQEEIEYVVQGSLSDEIADYQLSAFMMAVCFNGMNGEETWNLTCAMLDSGERADLSGVEGVTADKHSTGGVGDKTTLIVAPIAAACGVKVPKMSGRVLGFTGGTVDKLEAIPGYRTDIPLGEFARIVNAVGASVISQSEALCYADKKFYALRGVTATVDSVPLIVSSIMSKKLAVGAQCIVLDVKTGIGSFSPKFEDGVKLAKKMIYVGRRADKKVSAVVTDMEQPLGLAVGNALEVMEAAEVLKGRGPDDVAELSIVLAAEMLLLAGKGNEKRCLELARNALKNGSAFEKFKAMVKAHGGDASVLDRKSGLLLSPLKREIKALKDGWVRRVNAAELGKAASALGAGRVKKDDVIDHGAGVLLSVKRGDYVRQGDTVATIYSSAISKLNETEKAVQDAVVLTDVEPEKKPLILKVIR